MLTFRQKLNVPADLFSQFGEPGSVIFFDIETTGFSAVESMIYLICAGVTGEDGPYLIQWFAETPADEEKCIKAFLEYLQKTQVLVHFNGETFDVPFVEKRASLYGIPCDFSELLQYDFLKMIRSRKDLFALDHCRQKDVERLLGIAREDKYSGGELIEVYKQYLGRSRYDKLTSGTPLSFAPGSGLPQMPRTPSEALLALLLLHNAEDVEGLIRISSMFTLLTLLGGKLPSDADFEITKEDALLSLRIRKETHLPCTLRLNQPSVAEAFIKVTASGHFTEAVFCCTEGELKHFIDDYRNYFYLPASDTAIHKSAGAGLSKDKRKNATAATCYIKKSGAFFPIAPEGKPLFRKDYKSKMHFVDAKVPETLEDRELLAAMLNELSLI